MPNAAKMLRIDREPPPLTLGMLRLGRESQQTDPEPQPLDPESQHTDLNSEHICIMQCSPSLDSEHIDLGRLPRQVRLLRKPGVCLPR